MNNQGKKSPFKQASVHRYQAVTLSHIEHTIVSMWLIDPFTDSRFPTIFQPEFVAFPDHF
jgi:hypothetical protein